MVDRAEKKYPRIINKIFFFVRSYNKVSVHVLCFAYDEKKSPFVNGIKDEKNSG